MSWVRVDHLIAEHPKFLKAGPVASWHWVGGVTWSARHRTDGWLPPEALRRLTDVDDPDDAAGRLVAAGLWVPSGDGYRIHDYLEHQESRVDIERQQAGNRQRQAAARARRSRNGAR